MTLHNFVGCTTGNAIELTSGNPQVTMTGGSIENAGYAGVLVEAVRMTRPSVRA